MTPVTNINIPDITKELSSLWKQPQERNQIRACLFTLVIYAHEPRRIQYLKEIVDTILNKFPCRVIFIQGNTEAKESYLRANVSIIMSGRESHQKGIVACDQITIEATNDMLKRIPFLVVPHLVPDLPVYLLWGQTPFEEHDVFPSLQKYATRVIFDSECADNLSDFCHEMKKNLVELNMEVMDINWALISSWRDIFCKIFDNSDKITDLQACQSMSITYSNDITETRRHPKIRALYLQGWLAQRINWRYQRVEQTNSQVTIHYTAGDKQVVVTLIPQSPSEVPPGSIVSIEIETRNSTTYHLARKLNPPQVVVHTSSLTTCELPLILSAPDVHRGLTFMTEIFYSKIGDQYGKMLDLITPININL